jgi:hypothetical protein
MIALPPVISRLIPRLASPFDHEVVATARAIERALKAQKLDLHDLAAAVAGAPVPWSPPHRAESQESAEIRSWLEAVSREDYPNEWTRSFIAQHSEPPVVGSIVQKTAGGHQ